MRAFVIACIAAAVDRRPVDLDIGDLRGDAVLRVGDDIDQLIHELRGMLLNGSYILTEELATFEREFAAFSGVASRASTAVRGSAIAVIWSPSIDTDWPTK